MIIYKTGDLVIYETRMDSPSSDWTGKAEHIIDERNPENAVLIAKIKQCAPWCGLVLDDSGSIIDVTPTTPPIPATDEITAEEAIAILLGGDEA